MGQESGHGLAGSSAQGLTKLPSRPKWSFVCDPTKPQRFQLWTCVFKMVGVCPASDPGTMLSPGWWNRDHKGEGSWVPVATHWQIFFSLGWICTHQSCYQDFCVHDFWVVSSCLSRGAQLKQMTISLSWQLYWWKFIVRTGFWAVLPCAYGGPQRASGEKKTPSHGVTAAVTQLWDKYSNCSHTLAVMLNLRFFQKGELRE